MLKLAITFSYFRAWIVEKSWAPFENVSLPCLLKDAILEREARAIHLSTIQPSPLTCLKATLDGAIRYPDPSGMIDISEDFSPCQNESVFLRVETKARQEIVLKKRIRLPMTEVGGPWSACSNTCGWGMQSRIKCGKEEYKKCFGQDCPTQIVVHLILNLLNPE